MRGAFRPNPGWLALGAGIGLALLGLMAISTAAGAYEQGTGDAVGWVKKQAIFLVVAVAAVALTALPHHRRVGKLAFPLMILALLLLAFLLLPFLPRELVPVRNGARRWIDLRVSLVQPSELAKFIYVLALARYLRFRSSYRTMAGLMVPLLITFVPMGLIIVEPDLGTATVFLPVLFAMLLAAGAKVKHLLAVILIGLVLTPAMYPLLKDHQKDRIRGVVMQWRGDTSERQGLTYQARIARTLGGSGQGVGLGRDRAATVAAFNVLPAAHNDMIFAVILARWGLLGGVVTIGLYLVIVMIGLLVAGANKDPFARLIVVGAVAMIFTQMLINMGMTVGMLPITGLSLPFVSYGGSSLVANFLLIGLIMNVAARRPIVMARAAFEYDEDEEDDG